MSKQAILDAAAEEYLKDDLPEIQVGDTLKANVKVREAGKERIQVFEGLVIAIKNGGIARNVTIRKQASGVWVERTFPLHSPNVASFEVMRHGKIRRAKLYYIRDKVGKKARIPERR